MVELTEAGCVGFSQADEPIVDTRTLQRALQYATTYGYTVWLRPQDAYMSKGGVVARSRRGSDCRACRCRRKPSRCIPSSS